MKVSQHIKNSIIETISIMYVLLYIYAAVSKLLDFENFQVQLGQSPLLSAFASWVSWGVPMIEILIALTLLIPRYRVVGLFAAFSLMVMFTSYIIIILNFSSFVPCSCGGILEKLGWTEHLVFNSAFVLLALIGILLLTSTKSTNNRRKHNSIFITVPVLLLTSIAVVVIIYLLSEDITHHRNNFIRRFPHHPITKINELDLKHPSFYIAGIEKNKVYLGNYEAPLHVIVIDIGLHTQKNYVIRLSKSNLPFRSVEVRVQPPYFYLMDGTIPCIFRGNITDWKANLSMYGKVYFTKAEPFDSKTFIMRAISSKNHENVLGIIAITNTTTVRLASQLLEKQIDGVFDTDGNLIYNAQLKKVLYTYYYRNEYLVCDDSLNLVLRGHTIDTISRAQIKVAHIQSKNQSKLSAPPIIVNKRTATFGNYLFVHAGLMGRYETKEMWDKSSIIDVYDFMKNTYIFSFYVPNLLDQKMTDFRIVEDVFVALYDHSIVTYKIRTNAYEPRGFKILHTP
ncbi:MauE/DoxX family redox-associated membrane protein [Flavobacterium sp. WC2429]|uniref:MauE/DoxX family redox-associated membrane protein n=1 Tax=Flavobacterium sp. WC2429 TaxID=3234140 RepID=A0AB39WIV4_9FLAO